ncbi:glycosyltransferase family 4 protein [Flavisolibacter sp. BT320]|nr:glycosyltransferase family 4 protein [Flavisolibacter longurius]
MKVSYATTYLASDINQWSGLGYFISKALADQNVDLDYIHCKTLEFNLYDKIRSKIFSKIGKKYLPERSILIAKKLAEEVENKIDKNSDIIFSPSTLPIAYLKSRKPKVFYTDATFAGMLDFYKEFTNISSKSIKQGNQIELQALKNCDLAIYSSEWAANTAIQYYNIPKEKIKVIPFGANTENHYNKGSIEKLISNRSREVCKLIFIGVDWERKGGNVALKVAETLNMQGVRTELHVVGIKHLKKLSLPSYVIDHGFISKSTNDGKEKINSLLSNSHFLIVPSQAEAFGIVFCEASSFGVPSIATRVGGISTAIRSNINGVTFHLNEDVQTYVDFIKKNFLEYGEYLKLAQSSFNEFETRLNWRVSGKIILSFLKEL